MPHGSGRWVCMQGEVERQRGVIMLQLLHACAQTDFDMIDYLNELREGCLEAYTGIVQGLKGDDAGQVNGD